MIKNEVYSIIYEICGVMPEEGTTSLSDDLFMDSLRMVNLLVMIEERFSIELDDGDIDPFLLRTVDDVLSLAEKYVSAGGKNA